MTRLLAVDPGIRGCGVAVFDGDLLERALYVANPATSGAGPEECRSMAAQVARWAGGLDPAHEPGVAEPVDVAAFEWPQVYGGGRGRGDPNDLLGLVGVCAAIAALLPGAVAVSCRPAEWKGQVPKEVMNRRVEGLLSRSERARVERVGAKTHNVLDAVGIGLHFTGRLRGGRRVSA